MQLPYRNMPVIGEPRQRRQIGSHAPLGPGEAWTFAEIGGPAVITRLWVGVPDPARALLLRVWWDDEDTPSVDVPLIDFFGGGEPFATPLICVAAGGGFASHFPMPFQHHARLELVNVADSAAASDAPLVVQVDYDTYTQDEIRESPGMFHAQFSRENPASDGTRRFCVGRARGHGAWIGSTVQIAAAGERTGAWSQAAGELYLVDGEGRPRLLAGTAAGHCFGPAAGAHEHAAPCAGVACRGDRVLLYRLHHEAPIVFRNSLVALLGSVPGDYTAVSYWYQHEPHRDFTIPVDAGCLSAEAALPPGARDLPPRPQETIEWLYGDGTRKALSRHHFIDLHEFRARSADGPDGARETLWTTFTSPETRSGQFYVSYDNHIRVTLNDRLVFERDRRDGFGVDPVAVMIPAGKNTLQIETMMTAASLAHAWVIGFRPEKSEWRTSEEMEFARYPDTPTGVATGVAP